MPQIVNDEHVNQFHENGYLVIPGFLSPEEVQKLKDATKEVIQKYCQDMPLATFSAKGDEASGQHQHRDTYFAESNDKIRGFYEEKAFQDGQLIVSEKDRALNKIGHALHLLEPDFREATLSPKVKEVVTRLTSMDKPTVIQSMLIFKQPKIGGEVKPHQDATYLYVEPIQNKVLGFWIALDEANKENGCLYFVPGSHREGKVHQRYRRNPEGTPMFYYTGDQVPEISRDKFVPAEAKPGDLVLIDGLVIHQSEENTSDKPRLVYSFHLVDMAAQYAPDNWIKPSEAFVQV